MRDTINDEDCGYILYAFGSSAEMASETLLLPVWDEGGDGHS